LAYPFLDLFPEPAPEEFPAPAEAEAQPEGVGVYTAAVEAQQQDNPAVCQPLAAL